MKFKLGEIVGLFSFTNLQATVLTTISVLNLKRYGTQHLIFLWGGGWGGTFGQCKTLPPLTNNAYFFSLLKSGALHRTYISSMCRNCVATVQKELLQFNRNKLYHLTTHEQVDRTGACDSVEGCLLVLAIHILVS